MSRATWLDKRIRNNIRKLARLQRPLEKWVFPAVLLLWPLWGVRSGVDVSDATYSLGNYEYLQEGMWFFSTFLANRLGTLLGAIPGGGLSMLAMNVKTGLLLSAASLACYYVLQRMMPGWMIFLGEMLAVSLFWSPHVILYNLLSYVLLTFACLNLFLGESGVPRKRRYYVIAGILLGVNLFVRFSNALQVVLILAVWLGGYWSRRGVKETWKDTLSCLAGYLAGAGGIFLWICAAYGAGNYFDAIGQLFGMDGGYTFGDMMASTLGAYGSALRWFLIMSACVCAGVVFFAMPMLRENRWIKRILYIAGIVILIRFYYGRGMFTAGYQDYWCMFSWAMLFIILALIFDVIGIAGGFRATTDERFLSVLSLILILILPFGSNNYTFPILLDLFLIAPFFLWMFRRVWQESRTMEIQFPWYSMAVAVIAMTMVQGTLFHFAYSFRDGTDGSARNYAVRYCFPAATGMRTTQTNRDELDGMSEYLGEHDLSGRELLTYGDVPGLNYLFSMEPALSTTWADLASYPEEQFDREIAALGGLAAIGHSDELPVVILHYDEEAHPYSDAAFGELKGGRQEYRKAVTLRSFLEEAGYETVYRNAHYVIKVPAEVTVPGNY